MFNIFRVSDYHDIGMSLSNNSWKTEEINLEEFDIEFNGYYYGLIYVNKKPSYDEIKQELKRRFFKKYERKRTNTSFIHVKS